MTPAEFDRLAARTKLRERAREAARLVLVEGLSLAESSRRIGITAQCIHTARKAILRELREEQGTPPDWQVVTVLVPPSVAAKVRKLAESAAII